MEDKTYNHNTERISSEIDINGDQAYDNLIMDGDGCLNIGGKPKAKVSQIDIKIKNLVIKKTASGNSYELKFTAPIDRELLINVEIENLQDDIVVLSYGCDGVCGKDGKDGKDGKSSKETSDGKDGKDGSDGQDGGSCPNVMIQYSTLNESSITLEHKVSKGGEGGKGGKGGKPDKADKSGRAGRDGRDGREGRSGRSGYFLISKGNE